MRRLYQRVRELAEELRRRRVYQVAVLYGLVLFFLNDIADFLEVLGIPPTWVTTLVVAGAAAYPLIIVLAWIFELTTEGVKQTPPGPLSDFFGGTPARRRMTLFVSLMASLGLGWGAWRLSAENGAGGEASGAPTGSELDPRRMAVLYLDDYSEDGSLGYLASALTERLVHELSQVDGLRVASRNAVNAYRESELPLDSVVRALQVGSLVEGSVTRAGDRIRATIQLIDGETLVHLESRVVEGTLADPFAFQDSLTQTVARALRKRLGREIRLRAEREGTDDPEAWTAFARGRDELSASVRLREVDREAAVRAVERADSLFRFAEEREPGWEDPVIQRAVALERMASLQAPVAGGLDTVLAARADSLLTSVLEENPRSAEALENRGQLRVRWARTSGIDDPQGLLRQAEADVRAALVEDDNRAGALWALSEALVRQGRFAEAVEAAEGALERDAFLEVEQQSLWSLTDAVLQLGPGDEAVRLCDEGRRRYPGSANFVWCRFVILGSFPQVEPEVDQAHALLDSLLAASPDGTQEAYRAYGTVWLARVVARAGMADSARALLRQVREPGATPPDLTYDEAHVQMLLGDLDEAVRLLGEYLAYDPDTVYVRNDWWFEELHRHPPFRELVGMDGG